MKKQEEKSQVLTERMDIDSSSFDEFQALVLNKSRERSPERKKDIELHAIRFEMEDYLNSKVSTVKQVGDFLKSYLAAFEIRQNKFATYIGLKPSNLSKIIKGERSLSHELAFIFGKIFKNDPMIWLDVQDKNKLIELSKSRSAKSREYSLDDLIES